MYIKDKQTGKVRKYGASHHDSLRISNDGTYLTYENLQCGDGSIAGVKEHSGFLFCDEEGKTPEEDEVLCRYGADAYFDIGGWSSLIENFKQYQIDWLTSHVDIEFCPEEEEVIVRFLNDTAECYIKEYIK